MSDETKLDTPQLVEAWVRMYCVATHRDVPVISAAEVADYGIAELRNRLPVDYAARSARSAMDLARALKVLREMADHHAIQDSYHDQVTCDAEQSRRHEEQAEALDFVIAALDADPQPTQRTAGADMRLRAISGVLAAFAERDSGERDYRHRFEDAFLAIQLIAEQVEDVEPPSAQPTQRTAEEWCAACEEVAEKLWGTCEVYTRGRKGGPSFDAVALNPTALYRRIEAQGCDTEYDALEQLHAALVVRLEQKRRREGGE